MSVLDSQQKATVVGLGAKITMKMWNFMTLIDIFATALGNNIAAFVDQCLEMYIQYTDRGETRERIFQRGYKMIDMFMTQKRVSTIYCRIQKMFQTKNTQYWPWLKNNLGVIIKFSTLDSLGPC